MIFILQILGRGRGALNNMRKDRKSSNNSTVATSAIVIAKNAEAKIENCLKSLLWCDEIILVDTGSEDKTVEIAKKYNCKVFNQSGGSYSLWRNVGKKEAKGEHLIYLDTDEEIDGKLQEEIKKNISNWPDTVACFAIPRKNIILGKWLKHGGWYPDYVIRLFKNDRLIKWENDLHEQPQFEGGLNYLKNPIIHHKEKTLSEMLVKTNKWSEIEAKLMLDANHPPMTIARFLSAMFREFWYRFIRNLAFLDGGEGVIMGIYQVYSRFISYTKLWEMQLNKDNKGDD